MTKRRTAVVTGAGGGLGRTVVRRLIADDVSVVGVDIAADRLAEIAGELPALRTVVIDVTEPDAGERILEAVGGAPDILVNNAGILDGLAPADEVDPSLFDRVLAVNLAAPFRLIHTVLPGMLARGNGRIVNVASLAGLRGGRAGAAYTSSKWGLVGLTQSVAASHGALGIRCNAVCPGSMDTPMNHTTFSERGLAMAMRDTGAQPPVDPDVVATVVAFLVSDAATHLNGVAIPVDGGANAY